MNAAELEEIAAGWLLSKAEPDWSAVDQAALDAWLEADPLNRMAYWRLEFGSARVARLAALRAPKMEPDRAAAAEELASGPAALRRLAARGRRPWLRPAVAGVIAASLGAAMIVVAPATGLWGPKTYSTEIGGREVLPLADGTRVELNTATRLRAEVSRTYRAVWLDRGEVYFEVAHDPTHPFVVHAGPKIITVLGTRFSVRRDGDRVQVAVVEGRVRVADASTAGGGEGALVTRGGVAVADASSTLVAPNSARKVADELSWRQGRLRFDDVTLAEAATEFNRYNRTHLVVADPQAAAMHIGGSFEPENVRDFARLLQQAYGLRVRDDGQVLTISSAG